MGEPLDRTMVSDSRARASERLVKRLLDEPRRKKIKDSEELASNPSSTKSAAQTGSPSTETPSSS